MTWGYKCYKNVHTQLHWKLQHRSVQCWTGNLGMRESPTAAEIQRLLSAWLGPREIMLKLKSCFWISNSKWQNRRFLWSKLLPFGSFFERAGRQIVGQSFCRPKSALRCRCHVELRERWWCKPIPGRGWTDCEIQRPGRKEKFEKIVHICRLQILRCLLLLWIWMLLVHWPNSVECLPGTDDSKDGIPSSKPRTYVQMFLWCCIYFVPGKLSILHRFIIMVMVNNIQSSHDITWVHGRPSGQRAWRKRRRRPYGIWTSFCFLFIWPCFLFHPTALAQPSHPQLSTSAQPQVKLGEPREPSSILESSMLSTMDSVPSVPSVLDHPDFDGSSAKASVYDYEKLQAVQKVSPVLSFMSKPKHLYLKGIPWLSYGFP